MGFSSIKIVGVFNGKFIKWKMFNTAGKSAQIRVPFVCSRTMAVDQIIINYGPPITTTTLTTRAQKLPMGKSITTKIMLSLS